MSITLPSGQGTPNCPSGCVPQFYATLAELAPIGIFYTNADGHCLYVNPWWCTTAGITITEAQGEGWLNSLHPDDRERVFSEWHQAVQSNFSFQSEYRMLHPDGQEIWVLSQAVVELDANGTVKGYVGTVTDITERKQMENALQESHKRFESLVNSIDGIVWEVDAATFQFTFVSQKAEQLLGYPVERWLTEPNFWKEHVHQDDRPRVINFCYSTTQNLQDHEMEYRMIAVDGRTVWLWDLVKVIVEDNRPVKLQGVMVDVTKRKHKEVELQEMRVALEYAVSGISKLDVEGRYVFVNQAYASVVGYTPEEMLGMTWQTTIHPDELETMIAAYNVMQQNGQVETETRGIHRDGSIFYKQLVMISIYNEQHQLIGHHCFMKDITDRKQVEEALQKAQSRFAGILEIAQDAIISVDNNQHISLFNQGAEKVFGYTAEEILGQPLERLLPSRFADIHHQYVHDFGQSNGKARCMGSSKKVRQVGEWGEIFGRRKDGTEFPAEASISKLELGDEIIFTAILRDISDRKRSEMELKHQKEILQAMFDHIPLMVALFDQNMCIEFINPELQRVLGWSLQDWQQSDVLAKCYPDPVERQTAIEHILAVNGKWKDFMTHTASGETLYTSWANVRISNGYLISIGQDITDRKQTELELQQAKETAEVANQAKSLFLANMSHELRTPLNVILGFTQVMSRDRSLNTEQQENLKIIRRSGDHLLNLINDILDLSKIEAGHTSIDASNIDLVALLDTLRSMFQQKAVAKGIQFNTNIDPILPQYITADPSKLRQVLINLLSNAIKFTKRGSVTLRIKVDEEEGTFNFQELMNLNSPVSLLFEVEDTGIGIAAKDLDLIFNAFVQADAGKGATEGTGLGLTISRNLARLMGGNITVRSTVGQGTIFKFTLPVRLATSTDTPPEQINRQVIGLVPGQPQYRILVVDDQPENRLLLVKLLAGLGLDVQQATNGQEAIALWQVWHPHLIWMDIRMPVLNGYKAIKWIREQENAAKNQNQPSKIIALTAYASQSDRDLALVSGCDDYISKPFQEETLLNVMAKHLGLSYLYADSEPPSTSSDLIVHNILTSENLAVMPATWIAQLHRAALSCNEEEVLLVIEYIPPEHEFLATELQQLAQNFEFHRIVELAQSALNV